MIRSSLHQSRHGALVALLSAFTLLFAVQSAQAAVTPITTGQVDWGFKQSFRNYVVNGPAHGKITVAGGAQFCTPTICEADGVVEYNVAGEVGANDPTAQFRLPVASGTFDDSSNSLALTLAGSIHFYGHAGVLDMKLDDIHVFLQPDKRVIRLDITTDKPDTDPVVSNDVELVTIDLTGKTPATAGGETTWDALPTLMSAGQVANFLGQYAPGEPFAPLSIAYEGSGGIPAAPAAPTTPTTPAPAQPTPAALSLANGKSVKLKYKRSKSARVVLGTLTCASTSSCAYTLPSKLKLKLGKQRFSVKVTGPQVLASGASGAISVRLPAKAVKALKATRKSLKLKVAVTLVGDAGSLAGGGIASTTVR